MSFVDRCVGLYFSTGWGVCAPWITWLIPSWYPDNSELGSVVFDRCILPCFEYFQLFCDFNRLFFVRELRKSLLVIDRHLLQKCDRHSRDCMFGDGLSHGYYQIVYSQRDKCRRYYTVLFADVRLRAGVVANLPPASHRQSLRFYSPNNICSFVLEYVRKAKAPDLCAYAISWSIGKSARR